MIWSLINLVTPPFTFISYYTVDTIRYHYYQKNEFANVNLFYVDHHTTQKHLSRVRQLNLIIESRCILVGSSLHPGSNAAYRLNVKTIFTDVESHNRDTMVFMMGFSVSVKLCLYTKTASRTLRLEQEIKECYLTCMYLFLNRWP